MIIADYVKTVMDKSVYKDKYSISSESEGYKLRAAKHFILKGIKPLPYALIEDVLEGVNSYFSNRSCDIPFYNIFVVGDTFGDTILAKNIKKELQKTNLGEKVRVKKISVNRYGCKNKFADYNVCNLKELGELVKCELPNLVILDQDGTYAYCPLKKSENFTYKNSKMNRFGKGLPVRLGFGLFNMVDKIFCELKLNPRRLFAKSENVGNPDNLENLFEDFRESECDVIVSTLCNKRTSKKLLKKGRVWKYFQN